MKLSLRPISLFALLPLAMGVVSSCSDYDPLSEEGHQALEKQMALRETVNEYTRNFEERYGKIDPNHDWGMMMPGISAEATRATVDNRNEWVTRYHLNVPGWPDNYYDQNGNLHKENGYHYLNSAGVNAAYSQNPPTGSHPAGDVTDEEIQYVSWWFRTHRYPTSLNLHWTDFFVQGISADNDRDANGNVIDVLERYEKTDGVWKKGQGDSKVTYTIDYFSAYQLQPEDWSDGWDHIKNYNRNNSNILSGVKNLKCNLSDTTQIWQLDEYSYKSLYKDSTSTPTDISNRLTAFFESSGTENFRAAYSQNNAFLDWNYDYVDGIQQSRSGHSSWVLVHLEFVGPSGRVYKGNYLGFDYQCYKEELGTQLENNLEKYTYHAADGYYSNWIFKISPATPTEQVAYTGLSRRIMCEDLGNTYDFDFNDVVFDATYNVTQDEYNQYLNGTKTETPIDVTITLQAAGGTLPIYVGFRSIDDQFEAHRLLGGNPSSKPVNVDAPSGATSPIAIYHYKLDFPQNLTTDEARRNALNLNNIPILVSNNSNLGEYLTGSDQPWADEYTSTTHPTPSNKGSKVAPRAFGVPIGVCWMKECKFIETSYEHFDEWVQNQTAYGDNVDSPWYMSPVSNVGNIYRYSAYTKPAAENNAPVIQDYSALYGTKIPVHTLQQDQYNIQHYLKTSDFPSRPGKYTITIVCSGNPNNTTQDVQQPQMQRAQYSTIGYEGFSQDGQLINGSIKKDETSYTTTKLYVIQFSDVDVNDTQFANYPYFLLQNIYGKNDMIGEIYVKRTGDSSYQSSNMFVYEEYGDLVTPTKETDSDGNSHCYILTNLFTSGSVQVSVICQTQNDPEQWRPDVQIRLTDKTNSDQDMTVNSTFKVVDKGMNIAVCQFTLTAPLTNPNSYNYIELINVINGLNDGLNSIKEIRTKTVTQ